MVQTKSQKAEISNTSGAPVVSVPEFSSDFAIIDVMRGRRALDKLIKAGGKVLVRVDVLIDSANSRDDGVSIEFCGQVQAIRQMPNSVSEDRS